MRKTIGIIILPLILLCLAPASWAANLTTIVNESGSQAIWQTNGTGCSVSAVAGNAYATIYNGTNFGTNMLCTKLRTSTCYGQSREAASVFELDIKIR